MEDCLDVAFYLDAVDDAVPVDLGYCRFLPFSSQVILGVPSSKVCGLRQYPPFRKEDIEKVDLTSS